MMPDIRGIISLSYMVFAPRIARRYTHDKKEKGRRKREDVDESVKLYTGILAGMGGMGNPKDANKILPVYKVRNSY
jgi:hypothetical protein